MPAWFEGLKQMYAVCTVKTYRPLPSTTLVGLFDKETGCGTRWIRAEIKRGNALLPAAPICLRRYRDSTYPGRLTEIFNLPYWDADRVPDRIQACAKIAPHK